MVGQETGADESCAAGDENTHEFFPFWRRSVNRSVPNVGACARRLQHRPREMPLKDSAKLQRRSRNAGLPASGLLLAAGSVLEIEAGALLAMAIAVPYAAAALAVFTIAATISMLDFGAVKAKSDKQ